LFFRDFFTSGFNLIAGNIGDNRFLIAILEHWRAVAHGAASFTSPNFFWPEPHVLGYSEVFFLPSLPYIWLRFLGFDPYLSFELVLIVLKTVGFFGMVWLLRSFIRLSRPISLLGAALFTLSNVSYISIGHAQLMAVVFVPLFCCLALTYWGKDGLGGMILAGSALSGAMVLLGLLFLTSYYIAWFTVFAGCGILATALTARCLQRRDLSALSEFGIAVSHRKRSLLLGVVVFAATLVPFCVTYLPALKTTGARSYAEVLLYSAAPIDTINVGPSNWIWRTALAPLAARLRLRSAAYEKEVGWPPLTVLFCAGATLWSLRQHVSRRGKALRNHSHATLIALLGIACGILWVVSLNIRGHSLWWVVFEAVPGAAALRVTGRITEVLNVLVVVVAASACEIIVSRMPRRGRTAAILAFCVLLIGEQVNTGSYHQIDRKQELAALSLIGPPPRGCSAFLATSPAYAGRPPFAHQIDAMFVARAYNIPTLNGYSGWFPPDWDFYNLDKNYLMRAFQWARAEGVGAGLCGCALKTGTWSRLDVFQGLKYVPGTTIDFREAGNGAGFEAQGWGVPEAGGTWMTGTRSVLLLQLPSRPASGLVLDFDAHAFTPPQRPGFKETLTVSGDMVAEWDIQAAEPLIRRRVLIPSRLVASSLVRLEFRDFDPRSPAELGLSVDARKLGLAVHTARLSLADN
jgi:hypothetical protein